MKNILFWSTGKDSTATGIIAKRKGIKIDKIICSIPDPFKQELILKEKFESFMRCKVELVPGPSFENLFFRKKIRGKYIGTIYGWPMTMFKSCARILKWDPMKLHLKELNEFTGLIGIAKGENRSPPSKNNRSLLLENNMTEDDARELCIKEGLLNPLYNHFKRTGCVRCPKQSQKALWTMKQLEPEKYQWCLDNDHLSPVSFKEKWTFCDLDKHIINKFSQ